MTAVVYCRVSTKEQTENLSLATQVKSCREYCVRNGMTVAEVFIEAGESAKTADRPQLQRLLNYCRENKGRIHCVAVYNVSRFAREKYDHFVLRSLFHRLGITLRSVTEPIDDSSTGKFIEGGLAAAAQFDNDVKADRTRAGMRLAVEMGRWTYQAPLGYQRGGHPGPSLVFDPDCAALVRQAFERCTAEEGDRARVLAKVTALGLRNRKGAKVSAQTFAGILRNSIYTARIELPKWGFSGRGDWEPLVSREVFARAQRRRSPTAAKTHTRKHPEFPLRVFVRCALCSTPLTGSFSRGRNARYPYYSCRKCGEVRARKATLEALFMERLGRLQPRKEYLKLFNAIVCDVWEKRRANGERSA